MANNYSTVCVVGNLTRDPELRFLNSGIGVTNFGIAVNRSYKQGDEWVEETSFLDVSVWREQGENAAESLRKGDRVVVAGRLVQRSWETDTGERRSKVEIQAEEIGASLRFATVQVNKTERVGPKQQAALAKPPVYDEEPF